MPRGGSWFFAANLCSFHLSQFPHLRFLLREIAQPKNPRSLFTKCGFYLLKQSWGSYCKWVCFRTLGLILFLRLQAEETYLSAGAEGTREWTASPRCSFRPPCPLWGCLLIEATGVAAREHFLTGTVCTKDRSLEQREDRAWKETLSFRSWSPAHQRVTQSGTAEAFRGREETGRKGELKSW